MKCFFWLCLLLVIMNVFLESVEAASSKSLKSKNAPGKSKSMKFKNKRLARGRKNKGRRRDGELSYNPGELETGTESPELGGELETEGLEDLSEEDDEDTCMQCFDPCGCFGWGHSSNARKKRQPKQRQTKPKSQKLPLNQRAKQG